MKYILLISLSLITLTIFAQKQGQALVDSLLTEIPKGKSDTSKAKICYKLSDLYIDIDQKKALLYADTGYTLAVKNKWEKGIANGLLSYGNVFNFTGDFKRAIDSLNKALEMYKKMNYTLGIGNSTYALGSSYARMGEYPTATEYYSKALKIQEAIPNNERLIGFCLSGLANMFYMQKDYAKSLEYSFKSLEKKKISKSKTAIANQLKDIGDTYYEMNDSVKAEKYNLEALNIYTSTGNKFGMAEVFSQLGKVYKKAYGKSLSYFLQSKEIYNELNSDSYYTRLRDGEIAQVILLLVKAGDYKTANKISPEFGRTKDALLSLSEKNLTDVVQLCIDENDKENEYQFTKSLAEVQYIKGNYKAAYENFVGFYITHDSIYSQQNKNKIAAIEGEREVAIRDKKIDLANLSLSAQKKQKIGLIAGVGLLTIIGGLLFYQNHSRKKTNTTLMVLNNELDEANKIKSKFFSILSHDLRGPVVNLINFLHIQQQAPNLLNKEESDGYTKKITSSAKNLLENMEELLLWSKGQMEHFKPYKKNVAVSKLFTDIENNFLGTNNIKFIFNDNQLLNINTDEDYLKTIMRNLTSNAIKALNNIANATIEWKAWEENEKKYLSITDNGKGIDKDELNALTNDNTTIGIKTGLGFYLVRDMAKAIQCNILVNATSGKGTSFRLSV